MGRVEQLLDLEDCVRADIGGKARRLGQLRRYRPSLFEVPPGVLVRVAWDDSHRPSLVTRLGGLGAGPFAVRSCGLSEDGAEHSQAGRYETVLDVEVDRVPEAIARVRASLSAAGETGDVLIQPMVHAGHAGVAFSRSPHNAGLAICEYAEGGAEAIVAGRVEPRRIAYGRWSGSLDPEPASSVRPMLRHVFLVAMTLEQAFGRPQDVEWAWDEGRKRLIVLQSRDITATVGSPHIDREQARVARSILASRRGRRGSTVFVNSAVREVVSSPTRLTRSLVERLYSPRGALGRGLGLLGLPAPELPTPYVTSVFGRLTADLDVERRLFGFRPDRWWAGRRLMRRIGRDRATTLRWMRELVDAMGQDAEGPGTAPPEVPNRDEGRSPVGDAARKLARRARWFVESVYPTAYAATVLAQIAGEEDRSASLTSRLLHDLSALHHGGDLGRFLEQWGHRSADDYELSMARFAEAPESALSHARGYAALDWGPAHDGVAESFTGLKESAKDQAIRALGAVRGAALEVNQALSLGDEAVFLLDLDEVESLGAGTTSVEALGRRLEEHRAEARDWLDIDLGDAIGLRQVERLEVTREATDRPRGRMVSVHRGFKGPARLVGEGVPPALREGEVLVAKHLEPRLVAMFPLSAGCIADLGGSLSHAAIVAREMGHPVLVLPGSSRLIRDGDFVEVETDGSVTVSRSSPSDGR